MKDSSFAKALWHRWLLCFAAVLLLGACASSDKVKPTELGPNPARIGIRATWSNSVGTVEFPMDVRVVGTSVMVAGSDGVVAAIDSRTGGDIWRAALHTKLSAGVGGDGRYAAVVTRDNELVVLDAGKELWRQQLGFSVQTAPLVAGGRVFVLGGDRSVSAYDGTSGRKLWLQQRPADALVLAQAGVLMAVGDTLVSGSGGHLVGMNPMNGSVRWDVAVANSRGTNEVERLVDLVSGVFRDGETVCVRSFQSAVGCVDAARGRLLWSKTATGATGLHGNDTAILGSEGDGKMVAWRRTDGERLWESERLRFRGLTAPLVLGRSFVVGDSFGLLHFLSKDDGTTLNRMPTDGSAIAAAPVLAGQTLVAVTRNGGVYGFRPD